LALVRSRNAPVRLKLASGGTSPAEGIEMSEFFDEEMACSTPPCVSSAM
jgi:hypothetical protein